MATHGAGSFCSAPPGSDRTSTIARELATNPLLQTTNEDDFVDQLLGSLGSYPPYFRRLGEINRVGPLLLESDPRLAPLSVDEVRAQFADGAVLIDTRSGKPVRESPCSRSHLDPVATGVRELAGLAGAE